MNFIRNRVLLLFYIVISAPASAQNKAIDVRQYIFRIGVSDSNNIIHGDAAIAFVILKTAAEAYFDLTAVDTTSGRGMKVNRVLDGNKELEFSQDKEHVVIYFDSSLSPGSEKSIHIQYEGIPADGLIIGTNKFNHRTFFADNWPNRAHNWIPCNDHPADKASVEFIVTAPDHYQVIANGVLVEQTELADHLKLTDWKEDLALPTKVMVIGIADFAMQLVTTIDCIPVSSWIFPENRTNGFKQYSIAKNILPFYINYIGPYPYRKLANVQSKTRFGGMENAGNIFYFENSITDSTKEKGRRPPEDLFAHEIAHQWFGDEVSESDWPHVWLSEGFATYMTHLYMEHQYGTDSLKKRMQQDRRAVIDFYKTRKTPVVDTTSRNDLIQLLNDNSYQKGSWILHMLRRKLGDQLFQKGIQNYYARYKGRNASTDDFMHIMEETSRQDLKLFFRQWLYTAGHPVLQIHWRYNSSQKNITITIQQTQDYVFQFPLQILVAGENNSVVKTIDVNKRNTAINIPVTFAPQKIVADPNVNLLFEGFVSAIR